MDEIFVSWGMPNKSIVDRIIDRLGDLGMPVNEYSRELEGGGEIRPYIVESINRARDFCSLTPAVVVIRETCNCLGVKHDLCGCRGTDRSLMHCLRAARQVAALCGLPLYVSVESLR